MRIKSITARNYKIHREVIVELAPTCTVIGGPNECGKSTLAEAAHRALFLKAKITGETQQSMVSFVPAGFLSDQLGLQIIATVNCPFEELDPAIARPGRLVGYRQFRRLTRLEAGRLAADKGLSINDQQDFSLAEIFFPNSIGADPS